MVVEAPLETTQTPKYNKNERAQQSHTQSTSKIPLTKYVISGTALDGPSCSGISSFTLIIVKPRHTDNTHTPSYTKLKTKKQNLKKQKKGRQ